MKPYTEKAKRFLTKQKTYIAEHNEAFIGGAIVAGLVIIIAVITIITQLSGPRIDYKPVKACDLFTPAEAQKLIGGEKVIGVDTKDPVIEGNAATSKCSYTDDNADPNQMIVAAVAIRSAINDQGVLENKNDFATARANNNVDTVTGIGEDAYYNKVNGQLNVLSDKKWIIISYGAGAKPQENTPEKAVELAKVVLN